MLRHRVFFFAVGEHHVQANYEKYDAARYAECLDRYAVNLEDEKSCERVKIGFEGSEKPDILELNKISELMPLLNPTL